MDIKKYNIMLDNKLNKKEGENENLQWISPEYKVGIYSGHKEQVITDTHNKS